MTLGNASKRKIAIFADKDVPVDSGVGGNVGGGGYSGDIVGEGHDISMSA